jgi:hypothetical protein
MALRKLTVDGFNLELEDTQAAIVERVVADCARKLTDAEKARKEADDKAAAAAAGLEAATKAGAEAKTAHHAKVKELEAKILSDEAVEALVVERTKVIADAKKILGDEFDGAGKTVAQIVVAALDHVIANDEDTKAKIAPSLQGHEPTKAAPAIAKIAFDTAIAILAAGGGAATGSGAEYQRQVADALTGGKDGKGAKAAPKLGGRALMIARERGQVKAA